MTRVKGGGNMDMTVGATQNHRNAGLAEKQDATRYLIHAASYKRWGGRGKRGEKHQCILKLFLDKAGTGNQSESDMGRQRTVFW